MNVNNDLANISIISKPHYIGRLLHACLSLYEEKIGQLIPRLSSKHTLPSNGHVDSTPVTNSREANKQPQLQKQAQYFLMIYYHQYYLSINQLIITNKWACTILNWNHSFIWKAKTEAILQKLAICNKSGNKTHLQITCEQNMIGEMEKEKSTRASKGSSNIATYVA